MTAPGTEPDEILTAEPATAGEEGRPDAEPDLKGIGDNLMPEDLRAAERQHDGEPAAGEEGEPDPDAAADDR